MRRDPRHHGLHTSDPRAGFTLIEVLTVVVIMGIAGAVVVPQMHKRGSLEIKAASSIVIADLLSAQNEAITRQSPRRVVFDTATNSYKITDTGGTALSVSWKNGSAANYVVSFTDDDRFDGVTLSGASFGDSATVEFDALGAPSSGGTIDLVAGDLHYRITVAAFTGRVTVAPVPGS
jgi:prepilin-type N-terminal cleavage/methylation domain-containing protein